MPSDPTEDEGHQKRRWWDYETAAGNRPVKAFLMSLTSEDRAAIQAEMAIVKAQGMREARHVRGDIYEVRARGKDGIYRILFAREGKYKHVLLALEGFTKKMQQTPTRSIEVAETRLADWRSRATSAEAPPNHKVSRHPVTFVS